MSTCCGLLLPALDAVIVLQICQLGPMLSVAVLVSARSDACTGQTALECVLDAMFMKHLVIRQRFGQRRPCCARECQTSPCSQMHARPQSFAVHAVHNLEAMVEPGTHKHSITCTAAPCSDHNLVHPF